MIVEFALKREPVRCPNRLPLVGPVALAMLPEMHKHTLLNAIIGSRAL
jgi:hypothetical protein